MALKFVQKVACGERMPACYGLAWQDWRRDLSVAMPVPFNVLARVARDAWIYLSAPGEVAVNPRAAYMEGFRAGRASMSDDLIQAGVHERPSSKGQSCS